MLFRLQAVASEGAQLPRSRRTGGSVQRLMRLWARAMIACNLLDDERLLLGSSHMEW